MNMVDKFWIIYDGEGQRVTRQHGTAAAAAAEAERLARANPTKTLYIMGCEGAVRVKPANVEYIPCAVRPVDAGAVADVQA